MHADLVAALKAGWPRVHFVTVTLADTTIRWTDAGSVVWGANTYTARNAIYGSLDSISEITDGIDDDASPVTLTIIPPDLTSVADITAADAQGGRVTIHLGAVNPTTRVLVSEPYRLFIGELDQPSLKQGKRQLLEYEVITGEARGLEPNEEQRQTDAFHQMIWPDELGNEFATDGPRVSYWRADEPRRSIGIIPGRGNDDNKARQFTYEPEAPFVFPFGSRIGVAGKIRYQQGYGATNRYYDIYATLGASGPVSGLISVQVDDVDTTLDGFGKATNGEHAGEMWFQFLPGDQPSAALASPTGTNANSTPAPGWTSDHKLSGRPCFVWTGKENSKEDEYRGGIPRIIVTLEGLLGWDPRLDSTQTAIGGSGSCRLDNPLTWVLLTEGCIVGLNWAIGRWEGSNGAGSPAYGIPYACVPVGGIAAPLDTIDVAAFVAAAEIADGYSWVMAGAPMSDEDKSDVLADMLAASGARLARRGGMISCVSLAAAKTSVTTVTAADTVGAVEISLAPSRLDRRNIGIPSHLSEANHWEQTTLAPVGDPAWKTADGGRRSKAFDYPYVPVATQASQLCYLDLSHDREGVSAEWTFKPYMLQVEAGECFDIDEPAFLLEGVKALALRRSYDPSSGLVKIRFKEETDIKYEDMLDQVGSGPPATDPDTPPAAPTAPTITSVTAIYDTSGLIVTASLSVLANGPAEDGLDWSLRWRVASGSWVESLHTDQLADPTLQSGLVPLGETLDVQVAYFVGGVRTAWSATTTVVIDESDVIIDGNDP